MKLNYAKWLSGAFLFTLMTVSNLSFGQGKCCRYELDFSSSERDADKIIADHKALDHKCRVKCGDEYLHIQGTQLDVASKDMEYLFSLIRAKKGECKAMYIYYGLDKNNKFTFIFHPVLFKKQDIGWHFKVEFDIMQDHEMYFKYVPQEGGEYSDNWVNISNYYTRYTERFEHRMRVKAKYHTYKHVNVNYADETADPGGMYLMCSQFDNMVKGNDTTKPVDEVTFSLGFENLNTESYHPHSITTVSMFPKGYLSSSETSKKGAGATLGSLVPPSTAGNTVYLPLKFHKPKSAKYW